MIVGMPTTSFPLHENDVSGCFVLGMARALARCGHEIEVIAPETDHGTAWTRPYPGISVRWVPYARPRALQRTFHRAGAPDNLGRDPLAWIGAASWPLALAGALRTHTRGRWDAIVSHWGVPSGLVSAALRRRQRHVAFFHSADVHALTRAPRAGAMLARRIAHGSDALVFVSATLRAQFLRLAPEAAPKTHVIAMGVDAPIAIDRGRARTELGCEGLVLLALGRLVPIKGLDHAVETVAAMPGITLVIAGAGPERARLEASARASVKGSTPRVRFVGTITGLEKARWLAAADALVVPSRALASGRSEGAPTAVIEALAAGLPVLAHDTGGLPELVTHEGSGLLVRSTDPRALRHTITRFASDPELRARLAEGARCGGAARTWDSVGPRIDALLSAQGSMRRAEPGGRNAKVDAGSRTFSS